MAKEQLQNNPSTETQLPTDLDAVADSIQQTLLHIWADFVAHIPYLVAGILILIVTWLITKLAEAMSSHLFKKSTIRKSIQDLILRLFTICLWIFGFLLAGMVIFPGLTPTKALGGLGLLSVAVGLAFKDIFENFFAGILLLWRYPFESGDFIECGDITGCIENIEIRMTRIQKTSGELVVVPNAFLIKNPVDILTNQNKRRVIIIAGIAYDEDVGESVNVIQRALEDCSTVDKEKPIQVFPQAFGASSIDIEVAWWTDSKPVDIRASRGEVVTAVKKALDTAGIEIPFPYSTLTFKEPLKVLSHSDDNKD